MADFQFYLNRQGVRGPQGYKGDKGDDGKTPVPRTGTNTPIETTVIFDTGDGNPYETPNLKYPIEDRGGNMVMLDRTNSTQYYGTPDQATGNSYGVVKLATSESVLDDPLDSDVVTYELFDDNNQAIKATTDGLAGDITQLNTDLGAEATNRTNADTQLTNKINTDVGNEATARNNADIALSGRIDGLNNSKANKSDVYTKTQTDSLLSNKSNVGHTHNYNDLTNKPTIGNGTITITQGGVTKGTFTTNQSGNSTIDLDAGGGSNLTAGNAINISDNTISVKYDGTTIGLNASGQLQSLVEEPDMTQYYTKNQVDNLIPDVSGFASSIDVGTMFTGATETKEDNVKLDIANSYQNTTGGIQFVDNKYYLNWNNNTNNGFYAVPKTANETIPIMNVCVYKTTSVEDPITKQSTTTTVPFVYVSDWLNSTGNRNVTAYTQDSYSFGTDTITPRGMMDEEQYQAIQDLQNAGWNIFYKDNGLFQKVYSIEPSDVTGFYDFSLETIGYNFPLIDSTTGGVNNYTFYMGWQQTAPTVALHIRNTDNYSTAGMIFVSINITKADLDDTLNPTTGVTPDYEWENTRFAQYTDYATTQTAGLVKVGNNLSIAADGTLSADAQAPTAGAGVLVNGTAVSVNVDNSTITINGSGELVANLPNAATSNTLGLVQPDGTTISVDANGVISANIPTPETVDQTYDATSTHAQSGIAIAGAGFLTSITSGDVITALGYTPYNSSNPNGYTNNIGTVTSVNNIQPVNGDVTLTFPTVDQTYNAASTNAQSGVAIAGAGFLTSVPTATTSNLGLVQPDGTSITINNGVISAIEEETGLKQYSDGLNIYGDLVNTDGILSGFSDDNYASIPEIFFKPGHTIIAKFNYVTKTTARQYILSSEGFLNVDINTNSTQLRTWDNSANTQVNVGSTMISGSDYYLKIVLKDTGKDFYLTTDHSNWGTATTVADTAYLTAEIPNNQVYLGFNITKSNSYWNSTIDSNYIEIYDEDDILIYSSQNNTDIATTSRLGVIKPDGITLTVDEEGTLSANIKSGIGTGLAKNGNLNLSVSDGDIIEATDTLPTGYARTYSYSNTEVVCNIVSGSTGWATLNTFLLDKKYITNASDFEVSFKFVDPIPTYSYNVYYNIVDIPNIIRLESYKADSSNPGGFYIYNYKDSVRTLIPNFSYANLSQLIDKNHYYKISVKNGYLSISFDDRILWNDNSLSLNSNINNDIRLAEYVNYYDNFNTNIVLDIANSYIKSNDKITWGLCGDNGVAKATNTTYGLVKIDGTTITTDANGKLVATDTNTETFPVYGSGYTDYTNNNTEHTAPSDGYICLSACPSGANATLIFSINDEVVSKMLRISGVVPMIGGQFKVRAGDKFKLNATAATNLDFLYRFYPAEEVSK